MTLTKASLRGIEFGSAAYVVAHAKRARARNRNPSLSFEGDKNPLKALRVAQEVLSWEEHFLTPKGQEEIRNPPEILPNAAAIFAYFKTPKGIGQRAAIIKLIKAARVNISPYIEKTETADRDIATACSLAVHSGDPERIDAAYWLMRDSQTAGLAQAGIINAVDHNLRTRSDFFAASLGKLQNMPYRFLQQLRQMGEQRGIFIADPSETDISQGKKFATGFIAVDIRFGGVIVSADGFRDRDLATLLTRWMQEGKHDYITRTMQVVADAVQNLRAPERMRVGLAGNIGENLERIAQGGVTLPNTLRTELEEVSQRAPELARALPRPRARDFGRSSDPRRFGWE